MINYQNKIQELKYKLVTIKDKHFNKILWKYPKIDKEIIVLVVF